MSVRIEKPWQPLTAETAGALPGQLGVYQLADENGEIVRIGFAGGRSLFGLRSELAALVGEAASFRVEVTTAYMTRCRELLMVYVADHGQLPTGNHPSDMPGLGRLSPAGRAS